MSRDTRIAALCLATLALIILTSSVSATLAIAHGAPAMLRWPFKIMCHGIPHRCLTIFDTPMPICARCTGIYAGFLSGLLLFPMFRQASERVLACRRYQDSTDRLLAPAAGPASGSLPRHLVVFRIAEAAP